MDLSSYFVLLVSLCAISTCFQNYVRCYKKRKYQVIFGAVPSDPSTEEPIQSQSYSYHQTGIPKSSFSRFWDSSRLPGNIHRTYSHYQHKSETLGYFGHESLVVNNGSDVLKTSPRHIRQSSFTYGQEPIHYQRDIHSSASTGGTKGIIRSPVSPFGGRDASGGFEATGHFGQSDARVQDMYRGYGAPWSSSDLAWSPTAQGSTSISVPRTSQSIDPLSVMGPPQYDSGRDELLESLDRRRPEEMGGSSSHSKIYYDNKKANADAFAHGNFGGSQAQTHVQGGASKDGSFEAKAQSGFEHGLVQSQILGRNQHASSSSASQVSGIAQSQTQVQMDYSGNMSQALAQGASPRGSFTSAVQGGGRKGQANSQASGPGQTSSSVQMSMDGNGPNSDAGTKADNGQTVSATAQGGYLSGQSQTQLQGSKSLTASAQSSFGDSPSGAPITTATFLPNHTSGGTPMTDSYAEQGSVLVPPMSGQQPNGQYHLPSLDPYAQTDHRRLYQIPEQPMGSGVGTAPATRQYPVTFLEQETPISPTHPQVAQSGYSPGSAAHSFWPSKGFPQTTTGETGHPALPDYNSYPSGLHSTQLKAKHDTTGGLPQIPSHTQHPTHFSSGYTPHWGKKFKDPSRRPSVFYPFGTSGKTSYLSGVSDTIAPGSEYPSQTHASKSVDPLHSSLLGSQRPVYPLVQRTKPVMPPTLPAHTASYPLSYQSTNSLDPTNISKLPTTQQAQPLPMSAMKTPHPSNFPERPPKWPGYHSPIRSTKFQDKTVGLAGAFGQGNLTGISPQSATNSYQQIPHGIKLFPKLDPREIPTMLSPQSRTHTNGRQKLKPSYVPLNSGPILPLVVQPYNHPNLPQEHALKPFTDVTLQSQMTGASTKIGPVTELQTLNLLEKDGSKRTTHQPTKFQYVPRPTNYNINRPGYEFNIATEPTRPSLLSSLPGSQQTVPHYLQHIKPNLLNGKSANTLNFKNMHKTLKSRLDPTVFQTGGGKFESKTTKWRNLQTNNQYLSNDTGTQTITPNLQYHTANQNNISDYVQRLKEGLRSHKGLHYTKLPKSATFTEKVLPQQFTSSIHAPQRVNAHNRMHSVATPYLHLKDSKIKSKAPCNNSPKVSCSVMYKGNRKVKVCQLIPINCS